MCRPAEVRRAGALAAALLAGLLALVGACQDGTRGPTTNPSIQPTGVSFRTDDAATADPAQAGSPSPAASPGGPPTEDARGWLYLAAFPVGDALEVASVIAWGTGFIAVGYEPVSGEGLFGRRNGVLWSSAEGIAWERRLPAEFANATMLHAVQLGDQLYAFGSVCPPTDDELDCEDVAGAGIAAWRSADGASWQALALPDSLRQAILDGVTTGPTGLLVYGGTGDEPAARIWLSADGEQWQEMGELAAIDPISVLVAGPERTVAFGVRYLAELDEVELMAGYSDGEGAFQPAQLPPGQRGAVLGASWGSAGFVAVGLQEPLVGREQNPLALASADGQSWAAAAAETLPAETALRRVVAFPSGYLAIGSTGVAGESGRERAVALQTSDGLRWAEQGELGGAVFRQLSDAAVGAAGVVVFATDFDETDDEEPLGEGARAIHGWFLPTSELP